LVFARNNPHRLKPAPQNPVNLLQRPLRILSNPKQFEP
jgi:hypothetical protein